MFPGGLPLLYLSLTETGSNPVLSQQSELTHHKLSPLLTGFASYRYFPQLCLRREHHQGNTHIQTPSGVTHHLPRIHHTRRSLVSGGFFSLAAGSCSLWCWMRGLGACRVH